MRFCCNLAFRINPMSSALCLSSTPTKHDSIRCLLSNWISVTARCWPVEFCVKCFIQGPSDALPSLGTELRVGNFAVVNLCSYPLNCTPLVGISALSVNKTTVSPIILFFRSPFCPVWWASNLKACNLYSAL